MTTNYWAVLVCGIAAMVVGFVWYGVLFRKAWGKIMGAENMTAAETEKMKKMMGGMYFVQFILSLIAASVLQYHISNWSGNDSSLAIALCAWFGFVMTTTAGASLWSGKPPMLAWKMFLISSGAQVITFAVFGLILGAWS